VHLESAFYFLIGLLTTFSEFLETKCGLFFSLNPSKEGDLLPFFFIPPFFLLRSRTSWAHRCTRCCCEHWARECTGHRLLHNRRTRQVSPWAAGRAPLPAMGREEGGKRATVETERRGKRELK